MTHLCFNFCLYNIQGGLKEGLHLIHYVKCLICQYIVCKLTSIYPINKECLSINCNPTIVPPYIYIYICIDIYICIHV